MADPVNSNYEKLTARLRNSGTFTRDQVYTFFQKEHRMSHAEAVVAVENYLRDLRRAGVIVYEGHNTGWRFI